MLRLIQAPISGRTHDLARTRMLQIFASVVVGVLGLQSPCGADAQQVVAAIPQPPENRALLPAPLPNIVMVKVVNGRLNVTGRRNRVGRAAWRVVARGERTG